MSQSKDSLIECVAQAICLWHNGGKISAIPAERWAVMTEDYQNAYRDQAKAAIEAIEMAHDVAAYDEAKRKLATGEDVVEGPLKLPDTLIQCIAESRDALSGILPYIDGSGFSTIYAIKQAKEQIARCQAAIDVHEEKPNSSEMLGNGGWQKHTTGSMPCAPETWVEVQSEWPEFGQTAEQVKYRTEKKEGPAYIFDWSRREITTYRICQPVREAQHPVRESVNQEARELIEILHGAMLGLQSMSNETAKTRFDEYINLSGEFLLRNSIEGE